MEISSTVLAILFQLAGLWVGIMEVSIRLTACFEPSRQTARLMGKRLKAEEICSTRGLCSIHQTMCRQSQSMRLGRHAAPCTVRERRPFLG